MKQLFRKLNIFSILTLVVILSLGARMSSVINGFQDENGQLQVFSPASAVEVTPADEQPPSMTAEAEQILNEMQANDALGNTNAISDEERIQQDRNLPALPASNFSETEIEVLQSLAKRRDAIEAREQRLMQREALMEAAEQEMDRKISELAKLRAEIEGLLGQQQKVQEERLRSMVKIYESMKPKEAAAIFNTMDMDILLSVLSRMSERKSAPIFAAMSPQRAQEVTIQLVEQSQLPQLDLPQEN
tara:strand:+ start:1703 stop:2440 length:738 start_codon:yes stop_codon:yes gene_type:complete